MSKLFYLGKKNTVKPLLIIISGESNSGGLNENSIATNLERTINPNLKFLNNTSLIFEDWDINKSVLGHAGLENYVGIYHGWDLQISNLVRNNNIFNRPVYLVKTGAGASRIDQWNEGGTYYTNFLNRVNAAKNIIGNCDMVLFYSQGINDHVANTNVNTWQTETIAHFNKIRLAIGNLPIFMTLFDLPMTINTAFNTGINNIANNMTEVYTVSTLNLTLKDSWHWDFNSMKSIANTLVNNYLILYN